MIMKGVSHMKPATREKALEVITEGIVNGEVFDELAEPMVTIMKGNNVKVSCVMLGSWCSGHDHDSPYHSVWSAQVYDQVVHVRCREGCWSFKQNLEREWLDHVC